MERAIVARLIPCTNDIEAIVDDDWYDLLSKHRWKAVPHRKTFYIVRNKKINGRWTIIRMHRLILGVTGFDVLVDHKNKIGFDNRVSNLREVGTTQNAINYSMRTDNRSGYFGVSPKRGRWVAQIQYDGNKKHLGYFDTPEEAAVAYDDCARELHGEFAKLNFK